MWTRADLKTRAKAALKLFYWYGVLVCLIAAFLGAGTSGGISSSVGSRTESNYSNDYGFSDGASLSQEDIAIIMVILGIAVVVLVLVIIFGIFVSNAVHIGKLRYFLESGSQGQSAGVGRLFFVFGSGHYLNVIKIMFLKGLFETLWTMLLIIPGIYKHYEYYMVPYLLADHPDMDSKEAFRLSKEMMNGNKFNTFVLELSFVGWYLLGLLLCCIGGIFVNPYYEMTFVELYWVLNNHTPGSQAWDDQAIYTDTRYQA